jgi:hypothetical protein
VLGLCIVVVDVVDLGVFRGLRSLVLWREVVSRSFGQDVEPDSGYLP